MPVTHGVRGSSPLRTAREDDLKRSSFFVVLCHVLKSRVTVNSIHCKTRQS